ncbi:MAG TPA: DUF1080 domain-containing protein, partial [Candidatus Hydrogenedentes bacterium]|nr:DUF1080 domain-containing protein [Candidatus Hydrogenedentota bacterium]
MRIQYITAGLVTALATFSAWSEPKTVDEGQWINLFDSETTYGWRNIGDVNWTVDNGVLQSAGGTGGMLHTTSQFSDFELTAKIKVNKGSSTGIVFRASTTGHPTENGSSIVWIKEASNGKGDWHDIHVVAKGGKVTATLDGGSNRNVVTGTNERGYIGILYHHNGGAKVEVSEVKLRPLALTP